MNCFIFSKSGIPFWPQNCFIISISWSPKCAFPHFSMNRFITPKSGFPSSPQHCFIASFIIVTTLVQVLTQRPVATFPLPQRGCGDIDLDQVCFFLVRRILLSRPTGSSERPSRSAATTTVQHTTPEERWTPLSLENVVAVNCNGLTPPPHTVRPKCRPND